MKIGIADKETLDKVARAVGVKGDNRIYGLRIDKTNSNPRTRCEYIGDAVGMQRASSYTDSAFIGTMLDLGDWKDAWFVRDNYPCMLRSNGSVAYKLKADSDGYTYTKEDGTKSDIENESFDGNAMSAIPLVWLWQYEIGNYQYIYVANYKVNDNYHAYAHQRADGTIADYLFMGMYAGSDSWINDVEEYKLRSLKGKTPRNGGSWTCNYTQCLIDAQKNGANWSIESWSQRNLIQCLLMLMFKTTNLSTDFGYGNVVNPYDSSLTTGDSYGYGGGSDFSQFYGDNEVKDNQVKAFYMESLWGDCWKFTQGLMIDEGLIKVKMTPPYNDTGKGYTTLAGKFFEGSSKSLIKNTYVSEFGNIPIDLRDASGTTYYGDAVWYSMGSQRCLLTGGAYREGTEGTNAGLFALNFNVGSMEIVANATARITCLP